MGRPCGPGLETAQHLQKVVLRVRGERVPPRVDTDASTSWDVVVESHVRCLRLVELHVPVAVGWYLLAELLPQADLGEGRPVRRERPGGEGSRTWGIENNRDQYRNSRDPEESVFYGAQLDGCSNVAYIRKRRGIRFENVQGWDCSSRCDQEGDGSLRENEAQ